eukprot:scaffold23310_cov75-Phaeocystis_antarctica.AAC.3
MCSNQGEPVSTISGCVQPFDVFPSGDTFTQCSPNQKCRRRGRMHGLCCRKLAASNPGSRSSSTSDTNTRD